MRTLTDLAELMWQLFWSNFVPYLIHWQLIVSLGIKFLSVLLIYPTCAEIYMLSFYLLYIKQRMCLGCAYDMETHSDLRHN